MLDDNSVTTDEKHGIANQLIIVFAQVRYSAEGWVWLSGRGADGNLEALGTMPGTVRKPKMSTGLEEKLFDEGKPLQRNSISLI